MATKPKSTTEETAPAAPEVDASADVDPTVTPEETAPAAADVDPTVTPDIARAAEKRAAAAGDMTRNEREIEGLLEERRGYVQRKLPDRVAQVDEQIRFRGGTPPADAE